MSVIAMENRDSQDDFGLYFLISWTSQSINILQIYIYMQLFMYKHCDHIHMFYQIRIQNYWIALI